MAYVMLYPAGTAQSTTQEGYCWFERDNVFLKPNEVVAVSQCEQIRCFEDWSMSVEGCGVMGVPDNCRIVPDMTKPYPGCCGDVVCDPEIPIEEPPVVIEPEPEPEVPIEEPPVVISPPAEPEAPVEEEVVEPEPPILDSPPKPKRRQKCFPVNKKKHN